MGPWWPVRSLCWVVQYFGCSFKTANTPVHMMVVVRTFLTLLGLAIQSLRKQRIHNRLEVAYKSPKNAMLPIGTRTVIRWQ